MAASSQNPHRAGKMPSQRQLRMGEEIRHQLAEIVSRCHWRDPLLQNLSLTFTEVRLSPDLRNATIFTISLGKALDRESLKALGKAAGFLRGQLAQRLRSRTTPMLHFISDGSFDAASKIDALLHSPVVAADLAAPQTDAQTDTQTDDLASTPEDDA